MAASSSVNNNVITGISASQGATCAGIFLYGVAGGQVNNNTVESCSHIGIFVYSATQAVTVAGNTVVADATAQLGGPVAGDRSGIVTGGNFAPVTISRNIVANAKFGVWVDPSPTNSIPGPTVKYNNISQVEQGIRLNIAYSSSTTVLNNTISDADFGVTLISGNNLSGNTFVNVATLTTP